LLSNSVEIDARATLFIVCLAAKDGLLGGAKGKLLCGAQMRIGKKVIFPLDIGLEAKIFFFEPIVSNNMSRWWRLW
jgi:hypothetical protein